VLWANLHLLFWLSLIPFATGWMTATNYAFWPVLIYGVPLLGAATAYYILAQCLFRAHGKDSPLAQALGNELKEKISLAIYIASILAAFLHPLAACAGYFLVACIWLIPDRRIEGGVR
jgi:uncharacterized membrane protein